MKTLAAASALAVALLAAAAAGSASAQEYRIRISDLDLSTLAGANTFDARVDRAARRACLTGAPLADSMCVARFRVQARELLPAARRDDYARARNAREMAMVPTYLG